MGRFTRWLQKLNSIQEWSMVARGCVPAALVVLMYGQYLLWALYVQTRPDRDKLIAMDVMNGQIGVLGGIMLMATGLTGLGLWLRKHRPDSLWYQHLSANAYGLSLCWGGYMTGTLTFATGVVLMGAPLLGFILLERRVVTIAFLTAFATMCGLSLASAFAGLPYAPLLVAPHDSAGALLWTHSQLFFVAPHIVVNTALVAIMIERWRQREAGILHLSLTDALTGVHNRRSILALVERELARTRRHGPPLAVAVLDLDHFKKINDTWGHATGDRVLQAAAAALVECMRQGDAVGRFGGEEFLVLVPDTSRMGALQFTERCRRRLEVLEVRADNGERVAVSASFGLVCTEDNSDADVDTLVRHADEALYRAKQGGRNRVELAVLPPRPLRPTADLKVRIPEHRLARARWRLADWRSHVAGVLEWSDMAKTGLIMVLTILIYGSGLLWLLCLLQLDGREAMINVAAAERAISLYVIMVGLGMAFVLGAFLLHRAGRDSTLFLHAALQYFGISLVGAGYLVGMLYLPTGLMLTCSPMLGFILFGYRPVLPIFLESLAGVVCISYACALGWLPYAPLASTGAFPAYQLHGPFWMLSNYLFGAVVLAVAFVLADQVLGRWREREAHVRALSQTDMLTGAHNRRSILDLLAREIARTERHGPPLAVVILDLDHFKRINDTWGHPTGDRVLKAAAEALRASVRQCDAVGRYGGEEFLLLLPDTTAAGARTLAERCRERLAALVVESAGGERVPVSASFGLACNASCPALASAALIHAADEALYRAKANGRNRVEVAEMPVAAARVRA